MLRNEGDRLKRVIVCSPGHEYFNIKNLKEHNINEISDSEETLKQHNKLKLIMYDSGCEVIDIPELSSHPNSVFTRDTSLCTPEGHIRLRMGLDARKGEEEWMSNVLESLGEPFAGEITEPGTVEGGDIILAGKVAFVGMSSRTNRYGAEQISKLLSRMNYEVRIAEVKGSHLHLGGAMSMIGSELILCCRELFPEQFFKGFETVDTVCTGPSNGNVIYLGKGEVIVNSAENLKTIDILEKKGLKVQGIDLSEFRKGAGGPTCLILPVERI